MDWCRLYGEMLDDPKVGTLDDAQFRTWVELLMVATKADAGGNTKLKPDETSINWALRRNASVTLQELLQRELVTLNESGELVINAWADRQKKGDSSAARVAKFREKQRLSSTNASETLQKRSSNALEESREDKNRKDSGTSNAVTPNAKIALGDDGAWTGIPDALMATWKQAYPALSLDAELSKAAAWIIANPANKKSNYARFLTNWLTRAQDHAPRAKSGQAAQQPRNARFDAVAYVNRNRTSENHERTDDIIDV